MREVMLAMVLLTNLGCSAGSGADARYAFGETYPCGSETCTVGVSYCSNVTYKNDGGVLAGCYPEDACAQTPTCACLHYQEDMPSIHGVCACSTDEGRVNVICPQI